jgi:hypothetical protein
VLRDTSRTPPCPRDCCGRSVPPSWSVWGRGRRTLGAAAVREPSGGTPGAGCRRHPGPGGPDRPDPDVIDLTQGTSEPADLVTAEELAADPPAATDDTTADSPCRRRPQPAGWSRAPPRSRVYRWPGAHAGAAPAATEQPVSCSAGSTDQSGVGWQGPARHRRPAHRRPGRRRPGRPRRRIRPRGGPPHRPALHHRPARHRPGPGAIRAPHRDPPSPRTRRSAPPTSPPHRPARTDPAPERSAPRTGTAVAADEAVRPTDQPSTTDQPPPTRPRSDSAPAPGPPSPRKTGSVAEPGCPTGWGCPAAAGSSRWHLVRYVELAVRDESWLLRSGGIPLPQPVRSRGRSAPGSGVSGSPPPPAVGRGRSRGAGAAPDRGHPLRPAPVVPTPSTRRRPGRTGGPESGGPPARGHPREPAGAGTPPELTPETADQPLPETTTAPERPRRRRRSGSTGPETRASPSRGGTRGAARGPGTAVGGSSGADGVGGPRRGCRVKDAMAAVERLHRPVAEPGRFPVVALVGTWTSGR